MSDFYAKPSGGYTITGTYGTNNIKKIYDYLHAAGYNIECIIGILGNIYAESALNPWLWNGNTYDPPNRAYGLFQFYPGSDYINASGIPNHAPNKSTSIQTTGADPDDAYGQLYVMNYDTLGKWVSNCWRSYYSISDFPDLYAEKQHVVSTYGNGSTLTQTQFKAINNYTDSCFAFLMCFEGPESVSGNTIRDKYNLRLSYCSQIKPIIDNYAGITGLKNALILKKFIDKQRKLY